MKRVLVLGAGLVARPLVRYLLDKKYAVIMAVDNLPCEIPRESSQYFSSVLKDMVPSLAATDWEADFGGLDLPSHLKRALIVHKGELTPSYRYLHKHLEIGPDH
ncbi:MAG: hypothetical protein ABIG68_03965 [Acidobacteriota bacterium]